LIAKTSDYLRRNAIALTALGCALLALAGAGYAAITLPKGSVGTPQLRNGAVTPAKLNRSVSGVRAWAVIESNGRVDASSGRVKVEIDGAVVDLWFRSGEFPRRQHACSVVATPSTSAVYGGSGHVSVNTSDQLGHDYLGTFNPLDVALVC
jgi:hypothetical protein